MQKRKISFGKQELAKNSSPHPKRENPDINKHKRKALADKQHAQQFMQSYININHLLSAALCTGISKNTESSQHFPLASHLSGYQSGKKYVQNMPRSKFNTIRTKINRNETTNRTEQTFVDQDSQYQNYLKQYETLVKNSRSKEFVSPMAHKKQLDELITEFLSDMQDSDLKSSEISPKNNKNQATKRSDKQEKHQRPDKPHNQAPEIVKIQKIDLSQLKAHSYHNSYSKSNKKDSLKQQKQTSKRKQSLKPKKQQETYASFQTVSPLSINAQKDKKNRFERIQNIEKRKHHQKSHDKLKIEIINVQDLRKKKNCQEENQIKHTINIQSTANKQRIPEKLESQNNSYLRQNFYKISKAEQKKPNIQINKTQTQQIIVKKEGENIGKKPLKIEIQISQQFDDEQIKKEPIHEMQEQTQIIKLISKKVNNMIQDTQKIALGRGK